MHPWVGGSVGVLGVKVIHQGTLSPLSQCWPHGGAMGLCYREWGGGQQGLSPGSQGSPHCPRAALGGCAAGGWVVGPFLPDMVRCTGELVLPPPEQDRLSSAMLLRGSSLADMLCPRGGRICGGRGVASHAVSNRLPSG